MQFLENMRIKKTDALLAELEQERDTKSIHDIIKKLAKIKGNRAIDAVAGFLAHDDVWVRCAARDFFTDRKEITALLDLINSEDEKISSGAVMALGDIKSSQVVITLIKALEGKPKEVRKRIIEVLIKREDPKSIPVLINALADGVFFNIW